MDEKTPEMIDENVELSEKDAIKQIVSFSSEKLADIVIMYRYLGLYQDLASAAMKELASRRAAEDTFAYEQYIKEHLEKLPKFSINLTKANDLISKLKRII